MKYINYKNRRKIYISFIIFGANKTFIQQNIKFFKDTNYNGNNNKFKKISKYFIDILIYSRINKIIT